MTVEPMPVAEEAVIVDFSIAHDDLQKLQADIQARVDEVDRELLDLSRRREALQAQLESVYATIKALNAQDEHLAGGIA